jgi:hypothetical protein
LRRGTRLQTLVGNRDDHGALLLTAIHECREELESGAILTVDWSDKVRVRVLPLRV